MAADPAGPGRRRSSGGVSLGEARAGIATYYDADGSGNCSFDKSSGDMDVVALDMESYAASALCGGCIDVEGPKGSVRVRVVDSCPPCEKSHLDLSEQAFAKIADPVDGKVKITWKVVSCDTAGPVKFRFKEGSSQWWTGLQVLNHRVPIEKLEAEKNGKLVEVRRESYNYFVAMRAWPRRSRFA